MFFKSTPLILIPQSNELAYIIDRMQGQEIFGHVNLVKGERSKLSELASIYCSSYLFQEKSLRFFGGFFLA